MGTWVELTNGLIINLDMIEVAEPVPNSLVWRFYPPRTQRGGRPYGRPPERPQAYNEDAGYWEGDPIDPDGLRALLARVV